MTDLHAPEPRARWEAWVERACAAVGVDPTLVDIDEIHLLTKAVADRFERPMAPVSSFILGAAVAAGGGLTVSRRAVEATVTAPRSTGMPPRQVWEAWVADACRTVGVDHTLVEIDEILELTKLVAHRFERPMAPVSSFILGLAASDRGLEESRDVIERSLPDVRQETTHR